MRATLRRLLGLEGDGAKVQALAAQCDAHARLMDAMRLEQQAQVAQCLSVSLAAMDLARSALRRGGVSDGGRGGLDPDMESLDAPTPR